MNNSPIVMEGKNHRFGMSAVFTQDAVMQGEYAATSNIKSKQQGNVTPATTVTPPAKQCQLRKEAHIE